MLKTLSTMKINQACSLKTNRYLLKLHYYILTSWRLNPFQTHTKFCMEMLWTDFMPLQFFSIGPMIKDNPYQSGKISIYKQNFLKLCYVQQCWLVSAMILEFVYGYSVMYVIILCALQYTMLIFGFPSLCMLRQFRRNNVTNRYNYKPLLFLLFSTFTIP